MLSVNLLSTFVTDALERGKKYVKIEKLEQNKKRVHEMECTTPTGRKNTFLLYFHHQLVLLDIVFSGIGILHFVG